MTEKTLTERVISYAIYKAIYGDEDEKKTYSTRSRLSLSEKLFGFELFDRNTKYEHTLEDDISVQRQLIAAFVVGIIYINCMFIEKPEHSGIGLGINVVFIMMTLPVLLLNGIQIQSEKEKRSSEYNRKNETKPQTVTYKKIDIVNSDPYEKQLIRQKMNEIAEKIKETEDKLSGLQAAREKANKAISDNRLAIGKQERKTFGRKKAESIINTLKAESDKLSDESKKIYKEIRDSQIFLAGQRAEYVKLESQYAKAGQAEKQHTPPRDVIGNKKPAIDNKFRKISVAEKKKNTKPVVDAHPWRKEVPVFPYSPVKPEYFDTKESYMRAYKEDWRKSYRYLDLKGLDVNDYDTPAELRAALKEIRLNETSQKKSEKPAEPVNENRKTVFEYNDNIIVNNTKIPVNVSLTEIENDVQHNDTAPATEKDYSWRTEVPVLENTNIKPEYYESREEYMESYKRKWRYDYRGKDMAGLDINEYEILQEFKVALKAAKKKRYEERKALALQKENQEAEQRHKERVEKQKIQNKIKSDDDVVYTYIGVIFADSDNVYSYLAESKNVQVGDTVIVPTGRNNKLEDAKVVSVGQYTRISAPYPPEKSKYIIGIKNTKAKNKQ